MQEQLVLLGAVLATLAVLVACVPVLSLQLEIWRTGRRYELSKEEEATLARELPEVQRAVAGSLGPGASTREVRRMARESVIAAILRQRERRGRAPLAGAGALLSETETTVPEPIPESPQPGTVTREDLIRHRR